jgi:hypothetical protein
MAPMQQPWRLVKRGALLGALTGAVLASVYTMIAIPFMALALVWTNGQGNLVLEALAGATFFSLCAGPFAFVLGILPATFIGLLGGMLLGAFFIPLNDHLTGLGRAAIGASLGLVLAVIAQQTLSEGLVDPTQQGLAAYALLIFWIIGPGVLLIAGFAWVAWRLGKVNSPTL